MPDMIDMNTDNIVTFSGLTDQQTQSLISGASVAASVLLAEDRSLVASFTVNATGSGNYQGVLPYSVTSTLGEGVPYIIQLVFTYDGDTTTFDNQAVAGFQQV